MIEDRFSGTCGVTSPDVVDTNRVISWSSCVDEMLPTILQLWVTFGNSAKFLSNGRGSLRSTPCRCHVSRHRRTNNQPTNTKLQVAQLDSRVQISLSTSQSPASAFHKTWSGLQSPATAFILASHVHLAAPPDIHVHKAGLSLLSDMRAHHSSDRSSHTPSRSECPCTATLSRKLM